jgi:hypothetical protein
MVDYRQWRKPKLWQELPGKRRPYEQEPYE